MKLTKYQWFINCLILVHYCTVSDCWKPFVGHRASYGLHQSHPGYGAQSHSINTLGSSDTSLEFGELDSTLSTILSSPNRDLEDIIGYNYQDPRFETSSIFGEDPCSVKKYAFNYDGVVEIENKIPELEQFTICYWMRFTNHSGDHTLLTYSTDGEHRHIQFWVANSKNSSFLSMAIRGQQVYRLNYPLRTRQWHHICNSWNGKTGEWQVWLKAERIGRGFHNALVSHIIPGDGSLYAGGESSTGKAAHGLHFELTLVQIYQVALSAGKAHRDHKHHHAHQFDTEGREVTTTRPPPPINRPLPTHGALANGQIPTRVKLNFAQPALASENGIIVRPTIGSPSEATINTNFINGQFLPSNRFIAQQLLAGTNGPQQNIPFFGDQISNPFEDDPLPRGIFKRSTTDDKKTTVRRREKILHKRGLIFLGDGTIVNDDIFKFDGLAGFGGKDFKHDLKVKMNQELDDIEDEIKQHDHEAAEEEVRAVMNLCGSCDPEPFEGALAFAWKDAKISVHNGLEGRSVGRCANF